MIHWVQSAAAEIASIVLNSKIKNDKDRIEYLHELITGRKPSRKSLSEMMDYLKTIAEIHSNKKMEMSEFDIQTKSYTFIGAFNL